MPATWLARQLFGHFDADRVLEEMDKLELEARILECDSEDSDENWGIQKSLLAVTVATATATVIWKKREILDFKNWRCILEVGAGITVVLGGTVTVGKWYLRWRTRAIRRLTGQMDRTRAVIRKRRQVMFSLSMHRSSNYRNPLICRACRLVVSAIETISRETALLNNCQSWTDLYTDEIRLITARSDKNHEKLAIEENEQSEEMDWEAVMETLTSIFKLHASEYSRVVITDFLQKFNFQKFRNFLRICAEMRDIRKRMEAIESLALRSEKERDGDWRRDAEKREELEIGWKQQTGMALEAILEGLHSDSVSRSEVEIALRRTLVIIGTEPALKSDGPVEKVDRQLVENEGTGESVVFVKEQQMDIDMVFEGMTLSEADKLASRSACGRDVLLDGSESRRHEASLMGELQMVLEPRRTDFEKRERKALAKWYGVDEEQLEKEQEKVVEVEENGEQIFSGIGDGDGSSDPEAYDWRKDAETSAGLHQEADNIAFLNFLASRRVQDDVIE